MPILVHKILRIGKNRKIHSVNHTIRTDPLLRHPNGDINSVRIRIRINNVKTRAFRCSAHYCIAVHPMATSSTYLRNKRTDAQLVVQKIQDSSVFCHFELIFIYNFVQATNPRANKSHCAITLVMFYISTRTTFIAERM